MIEYTKDDIDFEMAKRAYYWSSFDPEKRAVGEQESYCNTMKKMCDIATEKAISESQKAKAKEMLEHFKSKLISLYINYLSANSRCASVAVTGASKFNYGRNEKAITSAMNKSKELYDYIDYFAKNLRSEIEKLKPQETKDLEVQNRITKEIYQLAYYIINKESSLFKANARGRIETLAKNNIGLIDFMISEIRRVEQERNIKLFTDKNKIWDFFKSLQTKQENVAENKLEQYGDIELVYNYEQDRLQLFYPSKPDYETIGKLKKNGWHWSPSNSCWQRQLTSNAVYNAKNVILTK